MPDSLRNGGDELALLIPDNSTDSRWARVRLGTAISLYDYPAGTNRSFLYLRQEKDTPAATAPHQIATFHPL